MVAPPVARLGVHLEAPLLHSSLSKAVAQVTANAFFFNIDNPTGRYKLDLDIPTDRTVAKQLWLLANWESKLITEPNAETGEVPSCLASSSKH